MKNFLFFVAYILHYISYYFNNITLKLWLLTDIYILTFYTLSQFYNLFYFIQSIFYYFNNLIYLNLILSLFQFKWRYLLMLKNTINKLIKQFILLFDWIYFIYNYNYSLFIIQYFIFYIYTNKLIFIWNLFKLYLCINVNWLWFIIVEYTFWYIYFKTYIFKLPIKFLYFLIFILTFYFGVEIYDAVYEALSLENNVYNYFYTTIYNLFQIIYLYIIIKFKFKITILISLIIKIIKKIILLNIFYCFNYIIINYLHFNLKSIIYHYIKFTYSKLTSKLKLTLKSYSKSTSFLVYLCIVAYTNYATCAAQLFKIILWLKAYIILIINNIFNKIKHYILNDIVLYRYIISKLSFLYYISFIVLLIYYILTIIFTFKFDDLNLMFQFWLNYLSHLQWLKKISLLDFLFNNYLILLYLIKIILILLFTNKNLNNITYIFAVFSLTIDNEEIVELNSHRSEQSDSESEQSNYKTAPESEQSDDSFFTVPSTPSEDGSESENENKEWNSKINNFKDLPHQKKMSYINQAMKLKGLDGHFFLINHFLNSISNNTTGNKIEVDKFLNTNLNTIINDRRNIQLHQHAFSRFSPFLLNNNSHSPLSRSNVVPYKSDGAFSYEWQEQLDAMKEARDSYDDDINKQKFKESNTEMEIND